MPVDMVLVISYNRVFEKTRGYIRIVKPKSEYNNVTSIIETHTNKHKYNYNYGLEMFRLWLW